MLEELTRLVQGIVTTLDPIPCRETDFSTVSGTTTHHANMEIAVTRTRKKQHTMTSPESDNKTPCKIFQTIQLAKENIDDRPV